MGYQVNVQTNYKRAVYREKITKVIQQKKNVEIIKKSCLHTKGKTNLNWKIYHRE